MTAELHTVTGAFGYSGRYIATRLLAQGKRVRTLTNSPQRENPFAGRIEVRPLAFDNPAELAAALAGTTVLYNTYWVRFNYADGRVSFRHSLAVENTRALFAAARQAGVRRIVHTSITNPSLDSPLEYFRGKAELERDLQQSGMSYAILRPTVLFGPEDILINNIAWMLRKFPVFALFGRGEYRLQPIFVDDYAALAVAQGGATENVTIDAIGPDTFTYRELVEQLGDAIGCRRPVLAAPAWFGYLAGRVMGRLLDDVTITWDEIEGLTADLLATGAPPAGPTRLMDWARANAATLGAKYASELARRKNRAAAYAKL